MFLLKYRVLHPYEPYTLQFDRGQVIGENAVVIWDKYRAGEVPMVLSTSLRRPRFVKTPNYSVLAQWLTARRNVDTVELGIANLPLIFGERWTTKSVNEALALRWINGIVSEAADRRIFLVSARNARLVPAPATRSSADRLIRIGLIADGRKACPARPPTLVPEPSNISSSTSVLLIQPSRNDHTPNSFGISQPELSGACFGACSFWTSMQEYAICCILLRRCNYMIIRIFFGVMR